MLETLIFVVFPFAMVFAAISDLLSMKIQNRVSVILVLTFAVVAPFTGMGWTAFSLHFAAGLLALVMTFGLFAAGGMGGGDAKLISATALWMGLSPLLAEYLLYSAALGGLLTIIILALRASPLSVLAGANGFLPHIFNTKLGVPYGVALGGAGLLLAPETPLMQWALARLGG